MKQALDELIEKYGQQMIMEILFNLGMLFKETNVSPAKVLEIFRDSPIESNFETIVAIEVIETLIENNPKGFKIKVYEDNISVTKQLAQEALKHIN